MGCHRKCSKLKMLKYKYSRHSATPEPTLRSISNHNSPGHSFKGSTSSLSSSTDGMSLRRKKKKAPPPPVPVVNVVNGTPTSVIIKVRLLSHETKFEVLKLLRNFPDTVKHTKKEATSPDTSNVNTQSCKHFNRAHAVSLHNRDRFSIIRRHPQCIRWQ